MPARLDDLLHDAAVLYRFVDFIGDYCREQERSQTYADASGRFFRYVEDLSAGVKQELPKLIDLANRFPHRAAILRSNLWMLKSYLRILHTLVKPAADAHTLTTPAPVVDLACSQLQKVLGMQDSKVVVLLAPELMYFQRPHTEITDHATMVQSLVPKAVYPPKLGFIELPYSQGPSFFTNLALYHEIGHFVYEELANSDPPHSGFRALQASIKRSLKRSFGRRRLDPQTFTFVRQIIERWTQEIFCDLFAIRLVGPAFSFSLIEMLGLLGVLSEKDSVKFNQTHPATAYRLSEHVSMLRQDSWWGAISGVRSSQTALLERLARIPQSRYRFYIDERHTGLRILITLFLNIVAPGIRQLVRQITPPVDKQVTNFNRERSAIVECLTNGVVPHSVHTDPQLTPVSIINAAFCFYLSELPGLIRKFDGAEAASNVESYGKWAKRLEMWTMKAIDDSQMHARFIR